MLYVTAQSRKELENLYMMFSQYSNCEPTELGRKQFYDYETYGTKPEKPDPFYERLCDGKGWFNVQQTDIRDKYLTDEWWGFYSYWVDWKGQRWVLRHLFSWCKMVPKWFFDEDINDDDITLGMGYIDPNTGKDVDW